MWRPEGSWARVGRRPPFFLPSLRPLQSSFLLIPTARAYRTTVNTVVEYVTVAHLDINVGLHTLVSYTRQLFFVGGATVAIPSAAPAAVAGSC